MLSGTSVLGAALASWGGNDGIARLKSKKEQPPRPLMKSSGFDPVNILARNANLFQNESKIRISVRCDMTKI